MRRMALALAWAACGAAGQTGGAVAGRVLNSTHNDPVAGAAVTLRQIADQPGQVYMTLSDAAGRYSIANVVPGTYAAQASKTGYQQPNANAFATPAALPPLTVEAGKPAVLDLHLVPEGAIAGRVLDPDGDPVRRASVQAEQYAYAGGKRQLRNVRNAQTNERGEYRLYNLPPGRYYLHVVGGNGRNAGIQFAFNGSALPAPVTGLAPAFFPGAADVAHATELELPPGGELDGIDVRLASERLYSIRGRILAEEGKEGANVWAQPVAPENGMRMSNSMRPDADHYIIMGLAPGRYTVIGQTFAAPLQQPQQPGQTPGPREFAMQPVEIDGRDLDNVDLTFAAGVTVSGVVKREGAQDGKGIVAVTLMPDGGPLPGGSSARVKPDGSFSVEVAPGTYRVRLAGQQVYLKSVLLGKDAVPGGRIDTARLAGELTLVAASDFGTVEGSVVDDAGKPVYNALVTLIPDQKDEDRQQRGYRSAMTKPDGKFSMGEIEPGEYKVFAWAGAVSGAWMDADFRKPFEARAVAVKVESNGRQAVELKAIAAAAPAEH